MKKKYATLVIRVPVLLTAKGVKVAKDLKNYLHCQADDISKGDAQAALNYLLGRGMPNDLFKYDKKNAEITWE